MFDNVSFHSGNWGFWWECWHNLKMFTLVSSTKINVFDSNIRVSRFLSSGWLFFYWKLWFELNIPNWGNLIDKEKINKLSDCEFVLRPLLFSSRGDETFLLSSECKTEQANFTDRMSFLLSNLMEEIITSPEALCTNT